MINSSRLTFTLLFFLHEGAADFRRIRREHPARLSLAADRYTLFSGEPIRFWDDYWFGKAKCFGDTFPHYWSVLSGTNALRLGLLLGEEALITDGENTIRNNLNLFSPDGSASCAYVYPHRVNGTAGAFYDELANDQDFALVNAMHWLINKHPV